MLFLDVIDLDLFLLAPLGVVGGKACSLLESAVGKVFALRFYHHVGSGDLLGMEPPVASIGKLEGQLVILKIILADIHVESVTADIVEGLAGDLHLFLTALAMDIAAFRELLLDLRQVFFLQGDFQGGGDGFQVIDLGFYLLRESGESLKGSFEFPILVKVFLRILLRREGGIQGNGDHFVRVVVQSLQGLCPGLGVISIGIQQFAVDAVSFPFFRVLDLGELQVILLDIAL